MNPEQQRAIVQSIIAELKARGLTVMPKALPAINGWEAVTGEGVVTPDFPGAWWRPLPPPGFVAQEPADECTDWEEMSWRDYRPA